MDPLHKDLKALGSNATEYDYASADAKLLETFPNPMQIPSHMGGGSIEISAPEFTSLCPKTGQPDFAVICLSYVPDKLCVESKSFKLYLGSFRQAGMFHEAVVQKIHDDLFQILNPFYLTVQGQFTARGGIKFWPKTLYQRPLDLSITYVQLTGDPRHKKEQLQ